MSNKRNYNTFEDYKRECAKEYMSNPDMPNLEGLKSEIRRLKATGPNLEVAMNRGDATVLNKLLKYCGEYEQVMQYLYGSVKRASTEDISNSNLLSFVDEYKEIVLTFNKFRVWLTNMAFRYSRFTTDLHEMLESCSRKLSRAGVYVCKVQQIYYKVRADEIDWELGLR